MLFFDALTLGKPRRTSEGYMAVRARAARAGVYDYYGREIDPEGKHFKADQLVKVYRPEDEVFSKDSVHSFLLKPITDDHPANPVTADNWKTQARGVNAGAMRDGEYLAFDLVLMDAGLIAQVFPEDGQGKRELSNGYASEIQIEDGLSPDGTPYQAVQRNIRGNHVAVVDKGRAGPQCRIGDAAMCDAATVEILERLLGDRQTYSGGEFDDNNSRERRETSSSQPGSAARQVGDKNVTTQTILVDGLQVETTDAGVAAIKKLQGQVDDAVKAKGDLETKVATLTTDKATLEAEKATLQKQLDDSKLTPQALRDAAKSFQAVADKGKALGVAVTDEMDEAAIMKAAVTAKVGDAAKDWNDVQIAASFATLSDSSDSKSDPVRDAISNQPQRIGDAADTRDTIRGMQYA